MKKAYSIEPISRLHDQHEPAQLRDFIVLEDEVEVVLATLHVEGGTHRQLTSLRLPVVKYRADPICHFIVLEDAPEQVDEVEGDGGLRLAREQDLLMSHLHVLDVLKQLEELDDVELLAQGEQLALHTLDEVE